MYNALNDLEDPASKARYLATLAGHADKTGLPDSALQWLKEGVSFCEQIDDEQTKASIKLNLALGFKKLGEAELASENFTSALNSCGENQVLKTRILKAMEQQLQDVRPEIKPIGSGDNRDKNPNHILAIYDTYEGGLKPIHFRTVARAAPLCYAFNLDLGSEPAH